MHHSHSSHRGRSVLKSTAAAVLVCCGAAQAADGAPDWHFSGYGTIGMAHANTDQADFSSSNLKAHGAGMTRSWSPNVDSRLGAQLSVDLDSKWSAVLQMVSDQDMHGSYRPRVEWANVKYQVTPDLSVRVGRISLPMYLGADYRKVGYAYTYARPPAEVYNRVPVTNSDGIDAAWRWRTDGAKHQLQASFGNNETELLRNYMVNVRALTGVAYTYESGALLMRASALTGRVTSNIGDELFTAFRAFGPTGNAIADRYRLNDKRAVVYNVGAVYDPGNWFVMGEAGYSNGHSMLIASRGAYVSAGYRHDAFTPYVTAAYAAAGEATSIAGVPTAGLPPRAAATATYINDLLNDYLGVTAQQTSLAVGMRWDFLRNVALKVQFDHLRPKAGSPGTLINAQPGFRDGRRVNASSVALDFVF